MPEDVFCERCGLSFIPNESSDFCAQCAARPALSEDFTSEFRARYGMREASAAATSRCNSVESAIDAVQAAWRHPFEFKPSDVLEANEWWYVPAVWIGHHGFIVNREDCAVISMDSGHTLDDWFWAREAGILSSQASVQIDLLVDLRTLRAALGKNPPGFSAWARTMEAVNVPARLSEVPAWLDFGRMRLLAEAGCMRILVSQVRRV